MTYLIYDALIALILVLFLWRGASKGFVLSVCGLLAILVAFAGALFLADALAPRVAQALEPRFAAAIEQQLGQSYGELITALPDGAAEGLWEKVPLPVVLEQLRELGLYEDLIRTVEQAVSQGAVSTAAGAAAAVAAAVAQAVAYAVIFLLAFLLLLIVWAILSHALDLVAKLPVLHTLNKLGGGAVGLVKGCLFLFVAAWLLRFSGSLIPQDLVDQTYLLKFFLTANPVALLTGV